ncbi:MAG: pyridoxamine 5'-phosphate oxidase family protein [Deltaproteobacteria bacterium]|nr:pyridoxamine 5'-phosphate oxidase family protein [Deltaproteobacteria bacterium]
MTRKYLEVLGTPAVLRAQENAYGRSRPVHGDAERDPLGPDEAAFIAARDSFYLATVSEAGWPYIQHRGGNAGFLRALDPHTLGFADYRGNRQLLSTGNLAANDCVSLFLMDYPHRARLKILGRARTLDARENPELVTRLAEPEMRREVERLILVDVVSFDWNCPKFITPRFTAAEVRSVLEPLQHRIAELEARLAEAAAPRPSASDGRGAAREGE